MLWGNKSLFDALMQKRQHDIAEAALLREVRAILEKNETERRAIKKSLAQSSPDAVANAFNFDLLETNCIFHLDQIRAVCIDYRLRFLSTHLYKSIIPEEAVSKIGRLQKEHKNQLDGFMIVAPSKQFHLENYDDPLLFAPIGNGYYYLIHKWGNDLHPLRKIMVSPMRSFGTLLLFLVCVSILFTVLITKLFFYGTQTGQFMAMAFLFTFKSFCGIALYYCFWKGKNFNVNIWNSPYYNK